jgi:hypothetical protein
VKAHLRRQVSARPNTKLLFVRRAERRADRALSVFWGSSPERGAALSRTEIESYADLRTLDFSVPGQPLEHPLFLVCTHGKHDRCCARYGRPLYAALREQVDDEWVWQSSHVGGDRFAGNVVTLPHGLYYGRVAPADVFALLDEHTAHRIYLQRYRGRSCYRFREQAAERVVREHAHVLGLDDLTLVASQRDRVDFCVGGRLYEVGVEETTGELTYLTCSAESLRHPRHYAARILRESAA